MDESKNIQPLKQVTFKYKLISFLMFFLFLNIFTFNQSQNLLNMKNVADYVNNINIDGSDFTGISNFLICGFNGVFYIINFIMEIIFNIIFITTSTFIFNFMYFESNCLEKEKLITYIRNISWTIFIVNILICVLLNYNINVIKLSLTIIGIYLPLPIIVQVLFFNKFKKTYQI